MGFAGQVFAARVAVGLAVPSQGALSKAGSLIGGFASRLTKRMHSQRATAAANRVAEASEELAQVRKKIETHQGKLDSYLVNASGRAMAEIGQKGEGARMAASKSAGDFVKSGAFGEDMAKVSEGELKAQWQGSKNAWGDWVNIVQQGSKSVAEALFNIDTSFGEGEEAVIDMKKVTEGYFKLTEQEQEQVKRNTETLIKRKQNEIEMVKFEMKLLLQKLKMQMEAGTLGEDQYNKAEAFMKKTLQNYEHELTAVKGFYEHVTTLGYQYNQAKDEWTKDGIKLKEDERASLEKVQKAEKEQVRIVKEIETAMKKAQKAGDQFTQSMKKGFTDAVQSSIAVLTAFYYKLNQNTQELINFERELMNANSVFNLTRKELYKTSEVITQFGQTFGMEMQNGAQGLYQLASAGLSANDSMKVLPETLKLSMAVQGDHNTIAKLTTQTLFGFGMEADRAAEITDKFAYTIQKSLVEYEDLSSAVKFALPFFTSTGQSIDQLLGSLQILTNRALEAGIAGRGLRQALAEFAEGAEDNSTAFRKMGIDILNVDGSMKQLTEIAQDFAKVVGEDTVNNTELLTALIQDLNVRGATAFIHLVQSADEFTEAVENTANAGGQLDEMVRIQNESMSAQIQILKNNVQMIFFMSDGTEYASGAMNAFHDAIIRGIASLSGLLVEGEDGAKTLTKFGQTIQDIAVVGIEQMVELLIRGIKLLRGFSNEGMINVSLLKLYTIPLKIILSILEKLGPEMQKFVVTTYLLNKYFQIGTIVTAGYTAVVALYTWWTNRASAALNAQSLAEWELTLAKKLGTVATETDTAAEVTGVAVSKWRAFWDGVAIKNKKIKTFFTWEAWRARFASNIQTRQSIALRIKEATWDKIVTKWKALSVLWINTETAAKTRNNFAFKLGLKLGRIWRALTIKNIIATLGSAAALGLATLAQGSFTIATNIAAVAATAFWIAATAGIILLVAGFALVVVKMAQMGNWIQKLKDLWTVTSIFFSDALSGIIEMFGEWGNKVAGDGGLMEKFQKFAMTTAMYLGAVIAVTAFFMLGIIEKVMTFLGVCKEAYNTLNSWLEPIGGVMNLIGTLLLITNPWIGALILVWKNWDKIAAGAKRAYEWAKKKADIVKKGAKKAAGKVKSGASKVLSYATLGKYGKRQAGGYISAGGGMAQGGLASTMRAYMVGERGPEMFMPGRSGQILNTDRSRKVLGDIWGAGKGLAKGRKRMKVGRIEVNELITNSAQLNKASVGINPFTGMMKKKRAKGLIGRMQGAI